MWRKTLKVLSVAALLAAGAGGYYTLEQRYSSAARIRQLEEQKRQLEQIVQRLGGERRVAEVLVVGKERSTDGVVRTSLLFVEETRDGRTLPPRSFTIEGEYVHLDAMVIKFERDFVAQDDPLRGKSIVLFTRLYGDKQAPESGWVLDEPGQVPQVYRGADATISEFELALWRDFWRLSEDAAYRAEKGVRIANGQGLWWPAVMDRIYTISVENDGGLNYTSEPIKPIVREAMKLRAGGQQQ